MKEVSGEASHDYLFVGRGHDPWDSRMRDCRMGGLEVTGEPRVAADRGEVWEREDERAGPILEPVLQSTFAPPRSIELSAAKEVGYERRRGHDEAVEEHVQRYG